MINAPVTLGKVELSHQLAPGRPSSRRNAQLCVVKKTIGSVSKTGKETIGVLVLITAEVRDSLDVEEFVEEPTSFPPSASVSKNNNVPGVGAHPWCFRSIEDLL